MLRLLNIQTNRGETQLVVLFSTESQKSNSIEWRDNPLFSTCPVITQRPSYSTGNPIYQSLYYCPLPSFIESSNAVYYDTAFYLSFLTYCILQIFTYQHSECFLLFKSCILCHCVDIWWFILKALIDRLVICFQSFTTKKAIINNLKGISFSTQVAYLWDKFSDVVLLGQSIFAFVILTDITKWPSIGVVLI